MDRTACVDVRALPLQLLLRRCPAWREVPAAVVDRDTPSGAVRYVNAAARARGVVPGMRYAAGLALARDLRAGVVHDAELDAASADILERLWDFSPRVEPSASERGVFWLDASGMRHLYPSLETWAVRLRDALRAADIDAAVAVGFTRFGVYGAAKAVRETVVFPAPEAEQALLQRVPLDRLNLPHSVLENLSKLGVTTLGGFIALPAPGIARRFGAEAAALHRSARNDGWTPLDPRAIAEPLEAAADLDDPEDRLERLFGQYASLLEPLLAELAARHEKLQSLEFHAVLDDRNEVRETVTPARPTRDANQILSLLRLRLGALSLTSGAVRLALRATGAGTVEEQLGLFQETPGRSRDAAHRALARVRAELGEDAVVTAQLQEAHLPEARFAWRRLQELTVPKPGGAALPPLIRRMYSPPIELPGRDRREPDGWLVARIADGPVEEVIGPHLIAGGWWVREAERAYYYVRTQNGRWLWLYHDLRRRRWFLQGEVQ